MRSFKPIAFFMLLILAGFFAAGAVSRLQRTPRLEISPEFNIGELVHDEELHLAVGFRNGGNAILHVEPPVPGCNCAKAKLDRSDFAPGETGTFQFVLRPANSPGVDYQQTVVVPSNDPRQARTTIMIRGKMQHALFSQPQAVHAAHLNVGASWHRQFVVLCSDVEARFNVTSVSCDLPGLSLSTGIDEKTGQIRIVNIDQEVAPQRGMSAGKIYVRTDHPRFRELTVPIQMMVESHLNVSPPSLLLRVGSANVSQQAVVTAPTPVELLLQDRKSSLIGVDLEPDDSRRVWTIAARLMPGATVSWVTRELLQFQVTGIAGERELAIPVVVVPSSEPIVAEK